MVGAHGVERNLLLHDHRAVLLVVGEGRDLRLRPLLEALEHLEIHLGDAAVRLSQVVVGKVEAELVQHSADVARDTLDPRLQDGPRRR